MMRRTMCLALALALGAACSGGKGTTKTGGSGSAAPIYAKKIAVAFGIQQQAAAAELFLQTTDETGKQVSHSLGSFPGQCATTTAADDMKAVIAVACKDGATGLELHAVVRDPDVIVLKMRVDAGVTPDPMSREEVTRIKIPSGAAVTAG